MENYKYVCFVVFKKLIKPPKFNIMKHLKTIFFIAVICFGQFALNAQQNDYEPHQLPEPDDLSPLFIGAINESAIYYGAEPSNSSNKPVLVFVHGFIDLANTWFMPGNDIYDRAYDDNYRTAFVAMTRGEGMWVNGGLLADMLEDITTHYGVSDVVIVAHSNGGKASEVAMFYENKSNLVNRVISLGTPFKGTGLADLAETPALNWLVDFIGLGGGTATSTTYYMEGVARPILDNEPDNQPNKFINFGAWGYNKGTTIAKPVMVVGGNYLNLVGAGSSTGGNDGVTPYYSSTRPGGNPQWPGYCAWWWCNDVSQYDHIDITHDYVVWDEIKPYFQGSLNSFKTTEDFAGTYDRATVLESNFEIISTMDGYEDSFTIGEEMGQVSINLMHPKAENTFSLLNGKTESVQHTIQKSKGHNKGINTSILLENPKAGSYTIESDAAEFAAMVAYEKGAKLLFNNAKVRYVQGEAISFETEVVNTAETAKLTGVVVRKTDLMGNAIEDDAFILDFTLTEDGKFIYTIPEGLAEGVYNLTINAEGSDFRRSLVSGFAVVSGKDGAITETLTTPLTLNNYPNPVVQTTTVTFDIVEKGAASLALYDAYGRLVQMQDVSDRGVGAHTFQWNLEDLANGTYFIEFKNAAQKTTRTIVKVK